MRRRWFPMLVIVTAISTFLSSWAITDAATVDAHDANNSAFFSSSRWADDTVVYSMGDLDSPLHVVSARNSMHYGPVPWENILFSSVEYDYTGVYDQTKLYPGSNGACMVPSNAIWLYTTNIQNTAVARTRRCTSGGNIVRGHMVFDDKPPTAPPAAVWQWHITNSWTVPAGFHDLRGIAVHEFGHAAGHADWPSGTVDCSGSDRHTMCPAGSRGRSWFRTLEDHDRHTMELAYPS